MITRGECDHARFRPMQPETCNCKKKTTTKQPYPFSLFCCFIHMSACCVHTHMDTHGHTPSSEMAMKPDHRSILMVAWEGFQPLIRLMLRDIRPLHTGLTPCEIYLYFSEWALSIFSHIISAFYSYFHIHICLRHIVFSSKVRWTYSKYEVSLVGCLVHYNATKPQHVAFPNRNTLQALSTI